MGMSAWQFGRRWVVIASLTLAFTLTTRSIAGWQALASSPDLPGIPVH
jgi:hypothetical protein